MIQPHPTAPSFSRRLVYYAAESTGTPVSLCRVGALLARAWCVSAILALGLLSLRAENRADLPLAGSDMARAQSVARAVSLGEFRELQKHGRALVIDVRPDLYYRRGHVPGAVSLPAARFQAGYARLKGRLESDKAQPLVLYCASVHCDESEQMRARLNALGFTRVIVFLEGWLGWQEAKLPEEKTDDADTPLEPWKGGPRPSPDAPRTEGKELP